MSTLKSIRLAPVANLIPIVGAGRLVALNVGPDSRLYAVVALQELDYRKQSKTGVSFAKTRPKTPQSYRVVAFHDGRITLDVHIDDEQYNIHDIQPLPNDELLLVCSRSYFRGRNDFDKNGRIYSFNGKLVREILLGDGIHRVQTTSTGDIWTSFFDEGVFGNCGWKNPVGSSGLVAWDSVGNKLYEFQPADGLDSICDCYALNVESDSSTWLCYYANFPLVHLRDREIESHWTVPVNGSHAFAVSCGFALFSGGYDERDAFHFVELSPDGTSQEQAKFKLTDEVGHPLVAELVFGRFDSLYLVCDHQVYRCDVEMAAAGV